MIRRNDRSLDRFPLVPLLLLAAVVGSFLAPGESKAQQTLQSPEEFLGFEAGERFNPHHRVVDYVRHVAEASSRVELEEYGRTHEHRPLLVAFVSSEENLAALEEIRTNNRRLAGLEEGEPSGRRATIVWLSHGIHGDESSSMEAAMHTLYALADPDPEQAEWLENTVVAVDPALNPDGSNRYVNWFNQMQGVRADPRPETREHNMPWPHGRFNHYLFDLNRDWAWQTQKETRARTALYHRWLPHVHVDFHEMGFDSPYYFAPAAQPFHEEITEWQREFQHTIGDSHVRYFDEQPELYYTREVFDLLYPSYGDTWPTFNGAIGMTYEQAGNVAAGRKVITQEGDTLTLAHRISNQHTLALSTVEVTSEHHDRVLEEFESFHQQGPDELEGPYRTFVIRADEGGDRAEALAEYLAAQEIRVGHPEGGRSMDGYHYRTGQTEGFTLSEEDLVVPLDQPKSVLAKVLLEPRTTVVDSITYDITAWSLPYVYGLDAYAVTEDVAVGTWEVDVSREYGVEPGAQDEPYAYVAPWGTWRDARFLSQLLEEGVRVRFAERPFVVQGRSFDEGALVMTRRGNEGLGPDFDRIVREAAMEEERSVFASPTGRVDEGIDFGSNRMLFLDPPQVAAVAGQGISTTAFGEIWHYFDHQIGYPLAIIDQRTLGGMPLDDYDVLILPDGNYHAVLDDDIYGEILRWAREGGTLIALGGALDYLAEREDVPGLELRSFQDSADDAETEPSELVRRYGDREQEAVSRNIPGAIFRLELDGSHPLGFGYGDEYFSLRTSPRSMELAENGWNVGVLGDFEEAHRGGFVGHEAEELVENSLVFGELPLGGGRVVAMADSPLFRAFWANGRILFANAVFFVGNR